MSDAITVSRPPARRLIVVMIFLGAVLVAAAAARLVVGTGGWGFPPDQELAWHFFIERLSRLVPALIVGSALAVSGVALQALLRNPLAEPFILGLSTGAGAGFMAQSLLLHYLGIQLGANHLGALLGAALSMLIVYLAARRRGMIDPVGLLLTGVVLSTINGSLIMLFNYLADPAGLRTEIAKWMMGYFNEQAGQTTFAMVAAVTIAAMAILLMWARSIDIATLSEAEAQSLGVHLGRLRTLLFGTASVLAAGAVVLAGPIAFVGLIGPHLARLLLGPSHGPVLVGSAILGASLVVIADVIASILDLTLGIGLLPIGIFTAIVGGPIFLWMLRPQLGRGPE